MSIGYVSATISGYPLLPQYALIAWFPITIGFIVWILLKKLSKNYLYGPLSFVVVWLIAFGIFMLVDLPSNQINFYNILFGAAAAIVSLLNLFQIGNSLSSKAVEQSKHTPCYEIGDKVCIRSNQSYGVVDKVKWHKKKKQYIYYLTEGDTGATGLISYTDTQLEVIEKGYRKEVT